MKTKWRTIGVISTCLWLNISLLGHAEDTRLNAVVLHVDDGNTITVRPRGERQSLQVRLIGIEAPVKCSREVKGQEPWGTRAQQHLALWVTRKPVSIEFDVLRPVGDRSVWGYVWIGDSLVNEEMARLGHAMMVTKVPNVQYVERIRAAQNEARENQRGIWNPKESLPEEPSKFLAKRQQSTDKQTAKENVVALSEWREGCIIGNKKTKKYHLPGGQYYKLSKDSKNAIFFANSADAEKAGYEKAVR